MYRTICARIKKDPRLPDRVWTLDCLNRVLDGTLYDVIDRPFHEEMSRAGEYTPLRERRPSVRYGLCRAVVDDGVALLFGEGRFPAITTSTETLSSALRALIRDVRLGEIMFEAATRGSVGSTAIRVRRLDDRVFLDVMDTRYLTPIWKARAPDTLEKLVERYIVTGQSLIDLGYDGIDPKLDYWFERSWDEREEAWFLPITDEQAKKGERPKPDKKRTVIHGLGFVPIVWIKNLPGGSSTGDRNDGVCTFAAAIESSIEIDYQLSQAGRGLKYSSDPMMLIKEPTTPEGELVKASSTALIVGKDGDAKLLEITGNASHAVLEYVRIVRELALESVHGNRSSADKITAAQSGRAMELLHQPLIWLADKMRLSYGEHGILPLLRMIAKINKQKPIRLSYEDLPGLPEEGDMSLRWANYFAPTFMDTMQQATALATSRGADNMSRKTAVRVLSATYDVDNPEGEEVQIAKDLADQDAREAAKARAEGQSLRDTTSS